MPPERPEVRLATGDLGVCQRGSPSRDQSPAVEPEAPRGREETRALWEDGNFPALGQQIGLGRGPHGMRPLPDAPSVANFKFLMSLTGIRNCSHGQFRSPATRATRPCALPGLPAWTKGLHPGPSQGACASSQGRQGHLCSHRSHEPRFTDDKVKPQGSYRPLPVLEHQLGKCPRKTQQQEDCWASWPLSWGALQGPPSGRRVGGSPWGGAEGGPRTWQFPNPPCGSVHVINPRVFCC